MGVVCTKIDLLPQPDGTMDAKVYLESDRLLKSSFVLKDIQSVPDLGRRAAERIDVLNKAEKKGR